MNTTQLVAVLQDALLTLEASRDELRDLDSAIGDGDLGITVSVGARAVREALEQLPESALPADVLRTAARGFAAANPSTFAALVGAGLAAAANATAGQDVLDRAGCLDILDSVTTTIAARGKAEPGDKTVLDALLPSLEELRRADGDDRAALTAMIAAAQSAVAQTSGLVSARGRAAWVGERSVGVPDGGATAYVRLLQALDRAVSHADV